MKSGSFEKKKKDSLCWIKFSEGFEKKFNITNPKEQLAWIDSQDAAAKWIGARPSNIIEVTRFSESSGDARSWRYCVANTSDA